MRLRDYAVERLGLSARQVQDLAHVDRELRELPGVEAAFVAGGLTWTKARLLCRVATREDEAGWLDAAQRMTARALAREVRAVDARSLDRSGVPETDEDGVEEIPRETVWLRVTPRVRAHWSSRPSWRPCNGGSNASTAARRARARRSTGGSDDLWKGTALCAAHHQRGVHAGIVRMHGRAPDGLRFELPLASYGPGERLLE